MKETGRTEIQQAVHEHIVIYDLYEAHTQSRLWTSDRTLTRFIDTMLRIQVGDVENVKMSYAVDSQGNETIKLKLPVMDNFEVTLTQNLKSLEFIEPNVRELLPEPSN